MASFRWLLIIAVFAATAQAADDADWQSADAIVPERSRIETNNIHEISTQVPGKIVYLNPSARGGMVKKGEVVVRLDSKLIEAQYNEAKKKAESDVLINYAKSVLASAEEKLKNKLKRNEEAPRPVFSEDEIRELELEVVKAQAELDKAIEDKEQAELARITKQVELSQYTVQAEISGIVTETHKKNVGSAVRQGDPIITITNLDDVQAILYVSPLYEDRINLGDRVLIRRRIPAVQPRGQRTVPSVPGPTLPQVADGIKSTEFVADDSATFEGVVTYIGPSEFGEENLMEVEARVKNIQVGPGKYMLRAGSFIDARILSP